MFYGANEEVLRYLLLYTKSRAYEDVFTAEFVIKSRITGNGKRFSRREIAVALANRELLLLIQKRRWSINPTATVTN